MSKFIVNELSENDWRDYKSVRLKSLQDSPDSFASTYEQETLFTPEKWKSRLRASPDNHDATILSASTNASASASASADQVLVGLLSGVIHSPDISTAHIYQMWVAHECRGMGVGTELIARLSFWASNKGVSKLQLSVTNNNAKAMSLYQSIGFIPIGSPEPLRESSSLKSQAMEITLN